MIVLGIETSCDETGIAIYDGQRGLIGEALYSQVDIHADYGGVVPELASRDHVRKTLPLISQVIDNASISKSEINGIAYTLGPGLMGALFVGATVGRSLAMALGVPAIGVHHMEGHLLAPMLEKEPPAFPFVALLVSGGHTLLVKVGGIGQYHILGESLDDAAGEAFDKAAKMLGLDYPGGPRIAHLAEHGNPGRFKFPRPMVDRPGLDFSFSGLKTYCLNTVNEQKAMAGAGNQQQSGKGVNVEQANADQIIDDQTKADIAWAFQEAVVDTLVIKCRRALQHTGLSRLVIAGGVSANLLLRERLKAGLKKVNGEVFYARPELCTDNGAMIAYAGYRRLAAGQCDGLALKVRPRWPLDELVPI